MYCVKCGTQLPDDFRFCWKCGQQLIVEPAVEQLKEEQAQAGVREVRDLQELLDALSEGSGELVISLHEGDYRLQQPLQLSGSITLIGAGIGTTRIICSAPDWVVRYSGGNTLKANDLAFVHEGSAEAQVVQIEGGTADFHRCEFVGGAKGEKRTGSGLVLRENVVARVTECLANGNADSGIELVGHAKGKIEANICRDNKWNGIAFYENSSGVASQNQCLSNEIHGIVVSDQSQPTLQDNICRDNRYNGIAFFGNAGGLARQNQCLRNNGYGILVSDQSQPTVEDNICQENIELGIAFFDNAGGIVRRNACLSNGNHGIQITDRSQPILEANSCRGNKSNGISYGNDARGTARQNECLNNENNGIQVSNQAQPMLEANICRDNKQNGISYYGNTGGIARQNQCQNNTCGIAVQGYAGPTLEENICANNKIVGIGYWENTGGAARRNNCFGNEEGNVIYVERTAHPTLEANTIIVPLGERTQYEYFTFQCKVRGGAKAPMRLMWTPNTPMGMTELEAKISFWQKDQAGIREEVNDFMSNGWEVVSELGPGAVEITTNYLHKGRGLGAAISQLVSPQWVFVGLTIVFRRVKGSGLVSAERLKKAYEQDGPYEIRVTLS